MMKVFVSTKETQGDRKNDFSSVKEGRLVTFGSECDGEDIDGGCGCRRSMLGLEGGATTTFTVVEQDMTRKQFTQIIYDFLESGRLKTCKEWAKGDADELIRMAKLFAVGQILEKRGNRFKPRKQTVN